MKCPMETRESGILLAYSSRELDAAERSRLDGHLENCPACRDFVRAQRAVWEALDTWEAGPVSADFNRRLYRRIDEEVSWFERAMRPLQSFGLRRAIPVAASAGLVLMAGLLIQRNPVTPQTAAREMAQIESLQPEQLELALDEMDALSQLSRPVRAEKNGSEM